MLVARKCHLACFQNGKIAIILKKCCINFEWDNFLQAVCSSFKASLCKQRKGLICHICGNNFKEKLGKV